MGAYTICVNSMTYAAFAPAPSVFGWIYLRLFLHNPKCYRSRRLYTTTLAPFTCEHQSHASLAQGTYFLAPGLQQFFHPPPTPLTGMMDCCLAIVHAALSVRTWLWIALFLIIDDLWCVGRNRQISLDLMCWVQPSQIKRKHI